MLGKRLKIAIIREEFVALTGDHLQAIVLNQFIYWVQRVHDFDEFISEEKIKNPDCTVALRHGWIYKKAQELIDETMLQISEVTMRRIIKRLVEKGWVEERTNPENKWDKTLQYRPDLNKIQKDLYALGYSFEGFPLLIFDRPHEESNIQNESSTIQKSSYIYKDSETTSETTNKLLSKKSIREDRFDQFYEVYPRKEARGSAEKAWKKLSHQQQDEVIRKSQRYFVLTSEKNIERQFIPLPATWLNSKRWLDEELNDSVSSELSYDEFVQKNNEPMGKIQKEVYNALGEAKYASWFLKAKFLQDASVLTIDLPTKFIKDWVSVHFKNDIFYTVSKMGIEKVEFIYSGTAGL